ncbi:hypothetical protein [Glaciimonas soli]|uniref:Uncharacterized protein n=1 Tax=Glaciimonas soli TaxID=2590999 RepID=A0A843YYK2_9BURK|nr:hypothetical protein [Glaciimonas soli]MQR02341.1 hypothetical protein [Glaciimonas soli]
MSRHIDIADGDIITKGGLRFRINITRDDSAALPWIDCEGHGVVSDWTSRDKRPGERILCTSYGGASHRFYDVATSMKIARRDKWSSGEWLPNPATVGMERARTVEKDFEYLRAWCNDEWHYVGISVTLLSNSDNAITNYNYVLRGIESNSDDYLQQVTHDFMDEMIKQHTKETHEADYWAERDVITSDKFTRERK